MLTLENLEAFVHSSPTPSVILYPDAPYFTIAEVNIPFLQTVNLEANHLIGRSLLSMFSEKVDTSVDRKIAMSNALELLLFTKNSQQMVVQKYDLIEDPQDESNLMFWKCNAYPVLDEREQVIFIVQNLIEVTSGSTVTHVQSKADHTMLTDENFEHPLFNDYPDAIFTLNVDGTFLSANKILLDIAECTFEELVKLSFVPFIYPEDLERVSHNFERSVSGEITGFESRIVSVEHHHRVLQVTMLPIFISNEVMGVYVIAKDITSIKQFEQELQEKRAEVEEHHKKKSDILESIADGFFAVDKNWTVTYWNKEAEQIFHIPREKMIGQNIWQSYLRATPLYGHQEIAHDRTSHVEEYFPLLNLWIEAAIFPLEDGFSIYFKDITRRKNIEEELEREKYKYEDLFNLNPLPQFIYDADTLQFLEVNGAAENVYGYSKEEFMTMKISDIRLEEDVDLLYGILKQVKPREINKSAVRHLTRRGEVMHVIVEGNSIRYGDKNARLVVVVDQTEKFKTRKALELSEQRFKLLVQEGSDIIDIIGLDGAYQYVNTNSKAILGVGPEYFIGKSAFDYIHEDDQQMVKDHLNLVAIQKRVKMPPFRFNIDGQYRWIETVVTNMIDEPSIAGIIANSRDVTERIANEMKIQESNERYNIVAKATSDAIWDWDIVTNKVVWNKGIKGIFGYKKVRSDYDWGFQYVHPEDVDQLNNNIRYAMENKKSRIETEYRFRCANGIYKNVLDRAFLIYNQAGEAIRMIGSMQDITEMKNSFREIQEQNLKLQDISWMQSHSVRSPVARIKGLTSLLLNGNMDEASFNNCLEYLMNSTSELDGIICDIIKKTERIAN